jgi:hypothetical protein
MYIISCENRLNVRKPNLILNLNLKNTKESIINGVIFYHCFIFYILIVNLNVLCLFFFFFRKKILSFNIRKIVMQVFDVCKEFFFYKILILFMLHRSQCKMANGEDRSSPSFAATKLTKHNVLKVLKQVKHMTYERGFHLKMEISILLDNLQVEVSISS